MKVSNANDLRYYEALREIAKAYSTPEQLRRTAQRDYGVSYHEALEMAYDNIQAVASDAIKGRRSPVKRAAQPPATPPVNEEGGK